MPSWPGRKWTSVSAESWVKPLGGGTAASASTAAAGCSVSLLGGAGLLGAGARTADRVGGLADDVFQNCQVPLEQPARATMIARDATAEIGDLVPPRMVGILLFWRGSTGDATPTSRNSPTWPTA